MSEWIPVLIAGILFTFSCGRSGEAAVDVFTVEKYAPAYAHGFEIIGKEDGESVVIRTLVPWQGAENISTELLICRGGEQVPDGYEGQILMEEAKRIVCMSSTQVAMLDALGLTDRIVGVSRKDLVSNSYVKAHEADIADIGFVGEMDYESLVASKPDLVMLYGMFGASPDEPKLRQLGIPFVYIGDYIEESPLGKAEWMVAIAEITGESQKGIDEFKQIPIRYENVRSTLPLLSSAQRPKVMVNAPYDGAWFMTPKGSYLATMIHDAGASYVFDHETGTEAVKIGQEEALRLLSQSDFWLNAGSASTLEELKRMYPKFAEVECVKAGRIFNNTLHTTPGGGNDYYESGVLHPDLILSDLIGIFHPELTKDGTLNYFKRINI